MKGNIIIITLALILSCLAACQPAPQLHRIETDKGYSIVMIDSCEYIEVYYLPGTNSGYYSLTHKGDCKNKLHETIQFKKPAGIVFLSDNDVAMHK